MNPKWTLNVSSDSPNEQAVVRSMLSLLKGRFEDSWTFTERHQADLILVRGPDPQPTSRGADDRRVIARFLDSTEAMPPNDALTLERPLRAMPFLDLLNEAGRRLRALHAAPRTSSAGDANAPPIRPPVAVRLYQLRSTEAQQAAVALTAADGSELAVVLLARGVIASTLTIPSLLEQLDEGFVPSEALRKLDERQRRLVEHHSQPLDALFWQAGVALAQSSGLAPWLRNDETYRLIGWPDFGAIGADEAGFRFSALLSKRAMTPARLATTSQQDLIKVTSFLNAASMCGLLAKGTLQSPATMAAGPTSLQRSLIGRLRAKLGLR